MKCFFTVFFLCVCARAGQTQEAMDLSIKSYPPMVSQGHFLGEIPALRDLPTGDHLSLKTEKVWHKKNYFKANPYNNPKALPVGGDPLATPGTGQADVLGPQIIPGLNFEGLRDPSVTPPDPSGDIGKNHYVQMINSPSGATMQVYDKQTGQVTFGPLATSSIWFQVGSSSIGDPIIQYDHAAERWIMMEMQGFSGGLLIAISQSSDPGGSWKAYQMQTLGFPDYPKLYVWHNAYIITVNEINNGNKCSGYAIERQAILNADQTFEIYRFEMPTFEGIQYQPATGADWEGGAPPPQQSPAYIFRVYDDGWNGGSDHIQVWEINVDWQNPGSSNLTGPVILNTVPFETKVCFGPGLFDCIEQPDASAPRITALENIIMYRAPYRNFGTYESVVFNHVADVSGQVGEGGDAAVRWYELQQTPGNNWSIVQQGTYAPDLKTNRFMGTISQDGAGNIALGYSVCSDATFPGLRLTGRRASDPPGQMTVAEYTLVDGTDSHYDERWGDYSSMTVDPYDDRTFWFTGEYQPAGVQWATRIGSFRVQRDTYDLSPVVLVEPVAATDLGPGEKVSVSIFNGGIKPASNFNVQLWFEGQLIATEAIGQTLLSEQSLVHTFQSVVDMPQIAKEYAFQVVVNWDKDTYSRNDTLKATVKKLTSNDAALVGRLELPGLVCGTTKTIKVILENTAGFPMSKVIINYRANGLQPFQSYNWSGNLAPGERDTISLNLTGIKNGVNILQCHTILPNDVDDEYRSNDTMLVKYVGNIDGNYISVDSKTNFGVLKWELLSQGGALLASGALSGDDEKVEVCAEDNTCYKLRLTSLTFVWNGTISLKDIFGNELLFATEASVTPKTYNFCTPVRKAIDVGAFEIVSPLSGANLSNEEIVALKVRNFGTLPQNNLSLTYRLNGGNWVSALYSDTLQPAQDLSFSFNEKVDLSQQGSVYVFEFRASVAGDQKPENDSIIRRVFHRYLREVALSKISAFGGCQNPQSAILNVQLRNEGVEKINTVVLETQVNGATPKRDTFSVNIDPGIAYEVLYAPIPAFQTGNNNVTCRLISINDIPGDDNPSNNTLAKTFNLSGDGEEVYLSFTTDNKPSESSWELRTETGILIEQGGGYTNPQELYYHYFCLVKDSCYNLRLYDAGQDGFEGNISLQNSVGVPIYNGTPGNFGAAFDIPFCTGTACAGLVVAASSMPASNVTAEDGSITIDASGFTDPVYYYIEPGGFFQVENVFDKLKSGVYLITVIDVNNCSKSIAVIVGTVSAQSPEQLIQLEVAPNPTQNLAWISATAPSLNEPYLYADIFDASFRQIQRVRLARWDDHYTGNLSLETSPAGVYHIRLSGWPSNKGIRIVKQ